MSKVELAIWRAPALEPAAFQRGLARDWAQQLLSDPRVAGLALHQLAADQRLPETGDAAGAGRTA
jgi:hypothetical protein